MNTEHATRPTLGIDVGGVIIDRVAESADTSFFGGGYLETPQVPDAIATIAALVKGPLFEGRGYVVSKCGAATEKKTREWLAHNGFHDATGIGPEAIRFCRKREQKAPICVELGITHFVDDRLEVLSYLRSVPHRFLFRPFEDEVRENLSHLASVTRVESWAELRAALRA
jgi:hypothetical protein